MKTVFLTSSPTGPLDGSREVPGLDRMNGFCDVLAERWKDNAKNLMITAFPDNIAASEQMTGFFDGAVRRAGLSVGCFDLVDSRNADTLTKERLCSYDVIWLGGGHVPTQNAFFNRINLREKIEGFEGIVIGISAGSMNSADEVYAEPEEPGEASDPGFVKFLRGLNLTGQNLLPHYQMVKDSRIDGKRLYEDIVFPDSAGRCFLTIPDGSWLLCENGTETVYGEAWTIRSGIMEKICENDHCVRLGDCNTICWSARVI